MAVLLGDQHRIKRVLVLGDNRLADSIISGLSDQSRDVHQAVHSQSTAESNKQLTVHKTGLSADALPMLFKSVKPDILFSTQSPGSYNVQKTIVDIAIDEGVKRVVLAEFGEDALNENIQARLPPVKERARVVEYLRGQASHKRIEWVGVATGCALEQALVSGNLGVDLKWQSATIHGTGNETFAASSSAWVERVTYGILEHWDDIKNEYLYASGMITSVNDILRCIVQRTNQQFEVGYNNVRDIIHEAERRFERGFPDTGMFLMERSVWFDPELASDRCFVRDDAKGRLGLISDGEDLDDVVMKVIHEATHHGRRDCGCE